MSCTAFPTESAMYEGEAVTRLLHLAANGDRDAEDQAYAVLYPSLRRVAYRVANGTPILAPTALLHTTILERLLRRELPVNSRGHFLALAARAMRQVLIDHARRRLREKSLDPDLPATASASATDAATELIALDEALERLGEIDADARLVVTLRVFGGLTISQIAAVTEVSSNTIDRRWAFARAWLSSEMIRISGDDA